MSTGSAVRLFRCARCCLLYALDAEFIANLKAEPDGDFYIPECSGCEGAHSYLKPVVLAVGVSHAP